MWWPVDPDWAASAGDGAPPPPPSHFRQCRRRRRRCRRRRQSGRGIGSTAFCHGAAGRKATAGIVLLAWETASGSNFALTGLVNAARCVGVVNGESSLLPRRLEIPSCPRHPPPGPPLDWLRPRCQPDVSQPHRRRARGPLHGAPLLSVHPTLPPPPPIPPFLAVPRSGPAAHERHLHPPPPCRRATRHVVGLARPASRSAHDARHGVGRHSAAASRQ